ncbi:carboxypeptidase S [Polychaeton citri CBS 116435]|uniref:Carboxypeptidase S n=1 Tax=Polychaeton citri CBS 116435 TaxID=1314669 RepID=A0A9P4PXE9_9PEZI|nr:carboxypeptidase S [Polychaeton citri CBS 116435]
MAWFVLPLALTGYLIAPSLAPTVASWISSESTSPSAYKSQCEQASPLFPSPDNRLDDKFATFTTSDFLNKTVARLSGAVKVDTQSFDDLGPVGEDTRWERMYAFATYLEATFPLVHKHLQLEKINTHGLLYTWTGSDSSLKPTLLMAHQDVVPVPDTTLDSWTHPPFDGVFDGKYIWGRGSSDCKNQLIAILETMESLLEVDFKPRRTIVLPFGFDEEISGRQGAGHLAPYLHERYGDDGIAAIVDEGATFERTWGTTFAKPGVGEKGYTDVEVTIRMPGGHSSIPSDHTSIGVMGELLTWLEREQYPTHLAEENPYYSQLQCGAAYSPDFPGSLKKLLPSSLRFSSPISSPTRPKARQHKQDGLAIEAARLGGPAIKYLMQTSQAADVISGGVKVNALPERTVAIVNHRINVGETPHTVFAHFSGLATRLAAKHNLTLHAFPPNSSTFAPPPKSITLKASPNTLPVAPVSPTSLDTGAWAVLAATTRALYGEDVVVAPGIMTGNTDTRYYWALTGNIYRFGPGYDEDGDEGLGNIHTVDEKVSVKGHVNAVRWFWMFVLNMDESDVA